MRPQVLLLLTAELAWGAAAVSSRPDPSVVQAMVRQLGATQYEQRQAASQSLQKLSATCPRFLLQQLAAEYRKCRDMEISTHLEQLMEPLARDHLHNIPPGFIGINMTWNLLPDSRTAIELQSVLAGFPGEQAGLQTGDLILSIDDKPMQDFGELAGFIEYVSNLPPGTPVDLLLQRGELQFLQTLVLGSRPDAVARGGTWQSMGARDAYQNWLLSVREEGMTEDPDFPVGHFPVTGDIH
jgi:membrane-associated protease RseP (regulator of RpoE activity)